MSQHAIKSLGDGRIGAYGVLFGSPTQTDLAGEFFADDTDFWLDHWEKRPMIYDHGQDPATKMFPVVGVWDKAELHAGKGVWLEGQLDKSHAYRADIEKLIGDDALKTSSDSVTHLLIKQPQQNGAVKIARWPLVGCSLTTTPCEHRMIPVAAMKSAYVAIGEVLPAEVVEDAPEEYAIKSQYLGNYIESEVAVGAIESMFRALKWSALYDACCMDEGETWEAERADVVAAFDEFRDLSLKVMDAIMGGHSSQTPEMAAKYLGAKKNNDGAGLLDGLSAAQYANAVLAAAKGYPERMEGIAAKRRADGRTFPTDAKRAEIDNVREALKAAVARLDSFFESPAIVGAVEEKPAEPVTDVDEALAAKSFVPSFDFLQRMTRFESAV